MKVRSTFFKGVAEPAGKKGQNPTALKGSGPFDNTRKEDTQAKTWVSSFFAQTSRAVAYRPLGACGLRHWFFSTGCAAPFKALGLCPKPHQPFEKGWT